MRYRNKRVWRIPLGLGEIQYGILSGQIGLWWRGRWYCLRKARNM